MDILRYRSSLSVLNHGEIGWSVTIQYCTKSHIVPFLGHSDKPQTLKPQADVD